MYILEHEFQVSVHFVSERSRVRDTKNLCKYLVDNLIPEQAFFIRFKTNQLLFSLATTSKSTERSEKYNGNVLFRT